MNKAPHYDTCPHCACAMSITFVRFSLTGVSTISTCPVCAVATTTEPERIGARLRKYFALLGGTASQHEGVKPEWRDSNKPWPRGL